VELIKTVKRWVSGSEKIFDIYTCTVSEVEAYTSDTGKSMVRIKIGDFTYSGLHNKWVYDFLCENEGSESFVVMWRAPKGSPMVAYVKDIWKDHLEGKETGIVPKETEAYDNSCHDSFVYLWINRSNDKKYIGKHKGTIDDGYIASSESFLADYNECPDNFKRTILAYGTDAEMHELETMLILQLKATRSHLYYNMSNNLRKD
jgi:hypothetical protein